jgi:pimeloyl-ACP methyl ester carboxylesterase
MEELSARVEQWRDGGTLEVLGANRVFVRHGAGEGPPIVFLHGFPSSSFDWRGVLGALRGGRPTVALDFLGFGLSEKPRRASYSLFEQADIVEALVGPQDDVLIVAHDMGTSVTTELMARDLDGSLGFGLRGVLLFNGSVIVERASLTWAQNALRSPAGPLVAALSNRRTFQRQFARLFSPYHPLSAEEADDQWALWRRAGGARIAHRLIRYIGERVRYAERWHGAVRSWPGELRLAWGLLDPVATVNVLDGLRLLQPGVAVHELPAVGHYAQIEAPAEIASVVEEIAEI